MDVVRFQLNPDPGMPNPEIRVVVNGRDLADIVGEIERPLVERDGSAPSIAGSYSGYTTAQLDDTISRHFLGSASSHLYCGPEGKTALLDCECGSPGCWTLMARVTATEDTVTWSQFEQVHRGWSYDDFSLMFDRAQYDAALADVELDEARRTR